VVRLLLHQVGLDGGDVAEFVQFDAVVVY